MDYLEIKEKIEKQTQARVLLGETMKKHTSMKIGGPADIYIEIEKEDEVKPVFNILNEYGVKIYFLGNGTNTIVTDKGIRGAVVKYINREIKEISKNENELVMEFGAGVQLKKICDMVCDLGYGPLADMYGIPAMLGGGIRMNCGAYEKNMSDYIVEVKSIDLKGNVKTYSKEEIKFGYRKSIFAEGDKLILSAKLRFVKVDKVEQREKMDEIFFKRKTRHPIEYPSAGSVFKRGENYYASREIDEAGLKGMMIGQMQVAEKHAGFIINKGDGTYEEFISLVDYIKKTIHDRKGYTLELEPIIVGEE